MKKLLLTGAMLASACSGKGEIIPTPSPEPHTPTTEAPGINTTALAAAPVTTEAPTMTEPEPTTTEVVATTRVRASTTTTGYLQPVATTRVERSTSAELAAIRECEQNDNPAKGPTGYASDTGNGYYGAYQFSLSTWRSVGGSGNPAHASPAEQDMRAQMMLDAGRRGEWPNC